MNRNDLIIWALRIAIIVAGFVIWYITGATEHEGVIARYFAYCEQSMPLVDAIGE